MNLLNISYIEETAVLTEGEMLFSYVVEEDVLECNESENMDSNMCKTLSTCTFFEKSVPGPSSTIN